MSEAGSSKDGKAPRKKPEGGGGGGKPPDKKAEAKAAKSSRFSGPVAGETAGEGAPDQKKIQAAQNDLTAIAGQKAVITRAKKAIAAFKITAGRPVGVRVTLRKDRMR